MQQTDALLLKLIALGLGHAVDGGISAQSDWEAVFQQALSHGLDAVAFDGLHCLYEGDSGSDEKLDEMLGDLRYEWFGFTLQCEQDYADYLQTLHDLITFYNTEGIPVLLLKGYGLSLDYPVPSHRPMGDIDLYLFGRQAEADRLIMEKWGIRPDLSHHDHSVVRFRKRLVENHYDLINVHAHRSSHRLEPLLKELATRNPCPHLLQVSRLQDPSDRNEPKKSAGTDAAQVLLPGADFNALFLLRHAASHFAATGINLRQLLDWLLFVEHHSNECDWDALYAVLRRENMQRFANSLNAIGVHYL